MDISIYVYGEHTSQACKVCHDEEMIEEKCADIFLWGAGTKDMLIRAAKSDIKRGVSPSGRAGGNENYFWVKCGISVLEEVECTRGGGR